MQKYNKTIACLLALIIFVLAGCATGPSKPKVSTTPQGTEGQQFSTLSDTEQQALKAALKALSEQKYKQAISQLKQLNNKNPNAPLPLANLGLAYFYQQNYTAAKEALDQALALYPKLAKAHNTLGTVMLELGETHSAEEHYKKAIEINKNYAKAYYNLAILYDNYYQKVRESIPFYKRYLQLVNGRDEQTKTWLQQLESSLQQ